MYFNNISQKQSIFVNFTKFISQRYKDLRNNILHNVRCIPIRENMVNYV